MRHIKQHCTIGLDSSTLLESTVDKLGVSNGAYNRILKIARTIADLEKHRDINANYVSVIIHYRSLDRKRF